MEGEREEPDIVVDGLDDEPDTPTNTAAVVNRPNDVSTSESQTTTCDSQDSRRTATHDEDQKNVVGVNHHPQHHHHHHHRWKRGLRRSSEDLEAKKSTRRSSRKGGGITTRDTPARQQRPGDALLASDAPSSPAIGNTAGSSGEALAAPELGKIVQPLMNRGLRRTAEEMELKLLSTQRPALDFVRKRGYHIVRQWIGVGGMKTQEFLYCCHCSVFMPI